MTGWRVTVGRRCVCICVTVQSDARDSQSDCTDIGTRETAVRQTDRGGGTSRRRVRTAGAGSPRPSSPCVAGARRGAQTVAGTAGRHAVRRPVTLPRPGRGAVTAAAVTGRGRRALTDGRLSHRAAVTDDGWLLTAAAR